MWNWKYWLKTIYKRFWHSCWYTRHFCRKNQKITAYFLQKKLFANSSSTLFVNLPSTLKCHFVVRKQSLLPKVPIFETKKWHFWWQNQNSKATFIVQTFPTYWRQSWNYHFYARFWLNFNFVDFRAYFRHFSLVKSAKNKIAFLQRKECSNQKIEENKSGLEFNFPSKSKCPSLNFEIWVFGANLTEPYWTHLVLAGILSHAARLLEQSLNKVSHLSLVAFGGHKLLIKFILGLMPSVKGSLGKRYFLFLRSSKNYRTLKHIDIFFVWQLRAPHIKKLCYKTCIMSYFLKLKMSRRTMS